MPTNGQKYYIMTGKAADNSKWSIYLLSRVGEDGNVATKDYSLWYCDIADDPNFHMWPYDKADSKELIMELLKKFIKTAYDE